MPAIQGLLRCIVLTLLCHGFLESSWEAFLQAQPLEGEAIYQTGKQLFQTSQYYTAITELKRFTTLFPHHPYYPEAQILIGLALQAERYDEDALTHFQHLFQQNLGDDASRVAAFKVGEVYFQQGYYQQAATAFQNFLAAFPTGPLSISGRYQLGLSWVFAERFSEAQQVWDTIPAEHTLAAQTRRLRDNLRQLPPPEERSPRLAGLLSGILPGAGHLYAGKPGQALTAFALNGLFLAGAAYALREELEAPGAILLFFETGWYLGTIHSATEAVRERNRQQRQQIIAYLRNRYALSPLTLQHLQEPELGLALSF